MSCDAMFEKSIIVVAHPDDEVLWFGSILEKVNGIVACYLENRRFPWWNVGRRKSLEEHPLKNISCLNIVEADVLNSANWENPIATEWGIELVDTRHPSCGENYKRNHGELKERLEAQLETYRNVFTHNPWGEYGHEEHVQVYRVLKGLQHKMGLELWYSSYVSKKSLKFMLSQREGGLFEYVTCETNRALAYDVMEVYKRNNCWTWNDDWEPHKRESFIKEGFQKRTQKRGRPFPMNLITDVPSASYSSRTIGKVKRLTNDLLGTVGLQITSVRSDERVVSLHPECTPHGTALLSWYVHPFLLKPGQSISNSHTDHWECAQVARTFLDLGYAVDVIDSHNQTFEPTKPYAFFFGHRINFDRIVRLLKKECIKIAYLDTAHWVFNNQATYQRKFELQQRKGVTMVGSHRLIELNRAIEHADYAVMYGNQFTLGTYRYANKPLFRVPISTCALFPWPELKDHDSCRANFLWLGSHGFVHKGLDLVLEAFAGMPENHLYVCGPLEKEQDFVRVFYKELYQTPNIHAVGWVDVNGPEFIEIANKCVGLVYPSCSEGQAGTVTTAMHAGLIPVVSYESGVDVEDCGVLLKDCSIRTIQEAVQEVSHSPAGRLQHMARKAWEYARANHTREHFAEAYKNIVLTIMGKTEKVEAENR